MNIGSFRKADEEAGGGSFRRKAMDRAGRGQGTEKLQRRASAH